MDRPKVWYLMKYRPVERLREQEKDALRKQAAASRKHAPKERLMTRALGWLMTIRATLQPSGEALIKSSEQAEPTTYPVEPEYPVIDWQAPEQVGE